MGRLSYRMDGWMEKMQRDPLRTKPHGSHGHRHSFVQNSVSIFGEWLKRRGGDLYVITKRRHFLTHSLSLSYKHTHRKKRVKY